MRLTTALCLLSLVGPSVVQAAPLEWVPAQEPGAPTPEIEVLSSDPAGLSLRLRLPALATEEVRVGSTSFQAVTIPGGGLFGREGEPALPNFTRLVSIPGRSGVTLRWSVEEQEDLPGFRLYPLQGYDAEGFRYEQGAYARDAFDEAPTAAVDAPAILRDLRVVPLTFQPVRYNPAQGVLRVARTIRVDLSFEGTDLRNAKETPARPAPPSFETLYRALVVNYEEGEQAALGVAPGTWVVICPNDPGVVTRLQPLLDWRMRKGFPVVLATTAETGTSASSIKTWIQNAYDNWPTPPEYIVIAGDATTPYQIPTWYENLSGYGGEGDHPYSQLDGADALSDVNIGRLSFNTTTELEAIVNKIVGYESAPEPSDPGWTTRACLVGDPGSSGYSVIQVQQTIKDRLRDLGYTEIDTIYAEPFVSQMTTALNQGDTFLSYRGYIGMSGWQNSNTYSLTNGWKMPFVVTITCDTGSFAGGTSRSEGFLRANAGASNPRGGIGAIGTATIGTHTRYNNCIHYGVFRGLLFEHATELGAALNRGKLEMYLNYIQTEPNQVLIWSYWNSLMGDPALDCWTGFPSPLAVTHPASVAVGTNSVTVSVQEDGGFPCEGAQVCLVKSGQTHVVGFTDSQGEVELPVSLTSQGNLLLTVTKHDRHPYLATIAVATAGVYVGFAASTIDDDASGESLGNGDGVVNPGETIELAVQLRNFGLQSASGVNAVVSSEDPFVTITDAQESYGTINGGGAAWSADDFGFMIAPATPHGHLARIGLDVTANEGQWHSLIEIPVVSADLVVEGSNVYNAGANGLLDPGETAQITAKLSNAGGASAANVSGTLTSLSNFITVLDGSGSFGTIAAGGQSENAIDRFSVSAAPDTYQGLLASFRLDLTYSNGLAESEILTVPVGTRSSDDPVGPDRYGYYAFDDTDVGYAEVPTYAWLEIDPNFGGLGTIVPLNDFGSYQDDSQVIDLPFAFQYYGQAFTKATVCSNGWIAMGSTWLTDYRNWTIPAAGGPDGMISVFWDDLRQVGNGRVYQYYDAANHRFIVQWSRMQNEPGSTETVQVILYDPSFAPTLTGDGVIVMQYNTVGNTDSVDNYCTVGIESPDGFDGLLYTFQNRYPAGAATLAAGRAVRFLPVSEVPSGTLSGEVLNASYGDAPIPGAEVVILELGRTLMTGIDGRYGGTVQAGTYTVMARHPSFAADTAEAVVILEQEATNLDFRLTDVLAPVIVTQPHPSTDDTVGPYPIPVTLTEYSGIEEKTLYYRVLDAFTPIDLESQGGDAYLAEIPGQPYITRVEYYVVARDSQGLERTDPPGAPAELYSFFVAPMMELFADNMEANQGWTVGAPDDNATTGIWERVNPTATFSGQTMVQPEDDHTTDPGALCFVTDGRGGGQGDYDVDGGKTTLTSPLLDLSSYGTVALRYHRWYTNDTGNSPGDDTWLVEVSSDGGSSWVTLEATNLSERIWKLMEFDLGEHIQVTDQVKVRFVASDTGGGSVVEAAVDDVQILLTGVTDAPESAGGASVFGLSAARPNPSQAGAAIGFSLAHGGAARLAIYDIGGRLVRKLVEGARPAGPQSVVWDGRDDRGEPVASGIYLMRLEGNGRREVKKIVRIE